jgi:hypothetical protein
VFFLTHMSSEKTNQNHLPSADGKVCDAFTRSQKGRGSRREPLPFLM